MIPWFQYNVVYIGPIPIQVWGFFVACGIGLSLFLLYRRAKGAGYVPEKIIDQAMAMVIVGLVCARLFHIIFYNPTYYLAEPWRIVQIWHGGMSSYGGFFGALLGFLWYARRHSIKKRAQMRIADMMSFTAIFGWIVARIGCFMIHDHIGKQCNCFLSIQTEDGARLEMALLEIIVLLPLALAFIFLRKKKLPDGMITSILFLYYGIIRFTLDFFRATDIAGADARYAGLTPAQYFSMVVAIVAAVAIIKIRKVRIAV